jgi:hypothetical protein
MHPIKLIRRHAILLTELFFSGGYANSLWREELRYLIHQLATPWPRKLLDTKQQKLSCECQQASFQFVAKSLRDSK